MGDAAPPQPAAPTKTARPTRAPSRASGGAYFQGASGRLLPLSIPLRFFGAAAVFHVLAWLGLGLGAAHVPRFAGGLGWPLAALHALTLGVLAMTAIGASLQLTPVATRQAIRSLPAVRLAWWLYMPGVAALVAAFAWRKPDAAALAALPVAAGLLIFGVLLARNLIGVHGTMRGVRTMGWLALLSLAMMLASALGMLGTWAGVVDWPHSGLLMLHIVFAAFGFMGMLALGLSNILVPMFALADVPSERTQLAVAAACALALALAAAVALDALPHRALAIAVACAAVAAGLHLRSMRRVLREGMRRELGGSFILVRTGWALLLLTLALAAWWAFDGRPYTGLAVALVVCALLGWLTTFLLGILQRIVPFLAAMHLVATRRRAPTASALTHEGALRVHRWCHDAALVALALGIAFDSVIAVQLAALVGLAGALAFAWFVERVWAALRKARSMVAAAKGP